MNEHNAAKSKRLNEILDEIAVLTTAAGSLARPSADWHRGRSEPVRKILMGDCC